jgi:DnaJ-class molecular chaperone
MTCPDCDGLGYWIEDEDGPEEAKIMCDRCMGTGEVDEDE